MDQIESVITTDLLLLAIHYYSKREINEATNPRFQYYTSFIPFVWTDQETYNFTTEMLAEAQKSSDNLTRESS